MEYHISKTGSDQGQGTQVDPFLTINKAASVAVAGDKVIVHEGIYREWVKPRYKGLSEQRRIIYQAAEDEQVVIKGSEHIQDWQQVENQIWKVILPNTFFGSFNPYVEEVSGDWLVTIEETRHLGDVYLNGMSFMRSVSMINWQLLSKSWSSRISGHKRWFRSKIQNRRPTFGLPK